MKLQIIILILVATTYVVNSQLINSNQDFTEILESINNNNNPSNLQLLNLIDFLQQYSNVQNAAQSIIATENECTRQLKLFYEGLMEMEEWALRMIDATAKLQSGLLEGNIMQVGHYDECLKIETSVNGTKINGQYCTAIISDSEEDEMIIEPYDLIKLMLSYGFCVPAACNATYLSKLARSTAEAVKSSSHLFFLEDFCDTSIKAKPLTTMAIISIVIFATVGIVIILSTIYDIISHIADKKAIESLIAFSLYTNGHKLFKTKNSGESMGCLNGMRVISMLWIVAGHRYMYSMMMPTVNLIDIGQWPDNIRSVFITAGNMAVDTFFVISGLLLVYIFMKSNESGRNVSVIMMYVHRIIRLTPSLAMLILFTNCLTYTGTGPFWPGVVLYFVKPCENNWWSTLLYIQNYVHPVDMCIGQTWYLAVDTQLYFLSPLLLFPLIKWPKRTILITLIMAVLCCVAAFEITWLRHLGAAHYGLTEDEMKYIYQVTHVRASPWLIGFITGYVIFKCRKKVVKMSKIQVVLAWSFAMSLMMGIILYHDRLRVNSPSDLLETSLFNALSRPLWAVGLSVIIFLCVTGYGGFVNKFLSSPVFTVLIRLNYNMYLLHIMVILYMTGQSRIIDYGSLLKNFYLFWGDSAATLLLSIIWTLSFESPIFALEKIIFGKKKRPSPAPQILNNINITVADDKVTTNQKIQ